MRKALLFGLVFMLLVVPAQAAVWQGYSYGGRSAGSYTSSPYMGATGSYGMWGAGGRAWGSYAGGLNPRRGWGAYGRSARERWRSNSYGWSGTHDWQRRKGYVWSGQTFRFANPRWQARYDSFCASHPSHWGC